MRVAVAMSGGMDSTAAALLLKKQGHDVVGLHMGLLSKCTQAWQDARNAAVQIGVPIQLVDLSDVFRAVVIEPFVKEYAVGRTPSPCLVCNRQIKMGRLFQHALSLGCQKLATGHYAGVRYQDGEWQLTKGVDSSKDQSYFLSMLTREMLAGIVLPMAELTKHSTRRLLHRENITVCAAGESQELCFVPDANYRDFLIREGVVPRPGLIVDKEGRDLGEHDGIIGFTIGQRRRLRISSAKPLYVLKIKGETNTVVVGTRDQLFVTATKIRDFNPLRSDDLRQGEKLTVKVRSTAVEAPCTIQPVDGDVLTVQFETGQLGVAPGQAAVLYDGMRVIGGGWIEEEGQEARYEK